IDYFKLTPNQILNYKQICAGLELKTTPQKQLVVNILDQLTLEDFLEEVDLGRFRIKSRGNIVIGKFERRSNGKNMLIPEEGGEPVFIPERRSKNALNGDKVQAMVYAKRKGKDPEAEIMEILERAEQRFIGVLDVSTTADCGIRKISRYRNCSVHYIPSAQCDSQHVARSR
ncbi:MAG: hypothetical protein ACRDC5_09380, partial [Vibrio sp.]